MKKTLTLLLAVALLSFNAMAQISFKYRTVEKTYFDKDNFDHSVNNEIVNGTSDATDTVFTWTRIEDIPTGWETAVCEDELCYPTSKNSNDVFLGAGKSMKFKLNFYSWGIRDCGSGKIVIVSKKNSENRDTFDTEVCSFNSASVKEVNKVFSVYPNPANNQLQITLDSPSHTTTTCHLYDMHGRLVQSHTLAAQQASLLLDISAMPAGVYYCKVQNTKQVEKLVISR